MSEREMSLLMIGLQVSWENLWKAVEDNEHYQDVDAETVF